MVLLVRTVAVVLNLTKMVHGLCMCLHGALCCHLGAEDWEKVPCDEWKALNKNMFTFWGTGLPAFSPTTLESRGRMCSVCSPFQGWPGNLAVRIFKFFGPGGISSFENGWLFLAVAPGKVRRIKASLEGKRCSKCYSPHLSKGYTSAPQTWGILLTSKNI